MIPADLNELGQEALLLVLVLSLPVLGAALLSGLFTGALQSFTRMSEPTVNHVARVAAVLVVLVLAAPWIAEQAEAFAGRAWALMQSVSR